LDAAKDAWRKRDDVKSVLDLSTSEGLAIEIVFSQPPAQDADLAKVLNLTAAVRTTNVHFHQGGRIKKFGSLAGGVDAFVPLRLAWYADRLAYQLALLHNRERRLANTAAFYAALASGAFSLTDGRGALHSVPDMEQALQRLGIQPVPACDGPPLPCASAAATDVADSTADAMADAAMHATQSTGIDAAMDDAPDRAGASYAYLLSRSIKALTTADAGRVEAHLHECRAEITVLEGATPVTTWLADLATLDAALPAYADRSATYIGTAAKEAAAKSKGKGKKRAAPAAASAATKRVK
jgi:hypothetical protein